MTALPSNLALVGEDLARATLQDARRSVRRRRIVDVRDRVRSARADRERRRSRPAGCRRRRRLPASLRLRRQAQAPRRRHAACVSGPVRVLSAYTTTAGAVCLTLTSFEVSASPPSWWSNRSAAYGQLLDDGTIVMFGSFATTSRVSMRCHATGTAARADWPTSAFYVEVAGGCRRPLLRLKDRSRVTKAISMSRAAPDACRSPQTSRTTDAPEDRAMRHRLRSRRRSCACRSPRPASRASARTGMSRRPGGRPARATASRSRWQRSSAWRSSGLIRVDAAARSPRPTARRSTRFAGRRAFRGSAGRRIACSGRELMVMRYHVARRDDQHPPSRPHGSRARICRPRSRRTGTSASP